MGDGVTRGMLDTGGSAMPLSVTHRARSLPRPRVLCAGCLIRPVEANDRCHACRNYLNRTGTDRSPDMFDRQAAHDRLRIAQMLGAAVEVPAPPDESHIADVLLLRSPADERAYAEGVAAYVKRNGRLPPEPIEKIPGLVGLVYFLQRVDRKIKIGTTTNLPMRKKSLETGAGPLKLVGLELGGYERERHLHAGFSFCRVHGEWFSGCAELIEYLRLLKPYSQQLMSYRSG